MDVDFQQVVEQYAPGMYRLACSCCENRSDAEDAVQEVLVRYLQRPPRCDGPEQLRAWLMTATVNKCRDLHRSAWRRKTVPLTEAARAAPPDDERLDVREALERLSPEQRSAVYLYYYEQMPAKQIAKILKISETAVRSRLFQARKRLKTLLRGE